MIQKILVLATLMLGFSYTGLAQFYPTQYRPPNQDWQYLDTPHYNILYAAGNDSLALQMGQLLEDHYDPARRLVGGELNNFPVILNDYNDLSNGFVTALHFRSEIELPPIKGKALNPQTGNWLSNVGPHELVHALQFNNLGKFSIPGLVSLLSPDIARSFHGAIPAGMLEGIAVHHETESISSNGGRGNLPFFYNQFQSTFSSGQRWSLGQMMHVSTVTRPLNRHYIGGYIFTSWLQGKYGNTTTRDALSYYIKYPFLGYGFALRHVTGKWPGQLYNQFKEDQPENFSNRSFQAEPLAIPFKGREVRRPKWLSDTKLIFYGSFYNARPGFYSYDLQSEKITRILTTGSVGDYQYDLSEDRSEMVFSYYRTDPIYDNTSKAEVARFNFKTGVYEDLSHNGRLYAPVFSDHGLLALQSMPAFSRLVSMDIQEGSPTLKSQLAIPGVEIISVAKDSKTNRLAVIANRGGNQALWITHIDSLANNIQESPDISFNGGSVYDATWHPTEDRLMFSSDLSGIHQLYEYHIGDQRTLQITRSPYNAFEGSYNSDGQRIAFIQQVENERLPAVLHRENFSGKNITTQLASPVLKSNPSTLSVVSDSIQAASQSWQSSSYNTGFKWLRPRTVLPVLEEVSRRDVYQTGISLHSSNLLQSQSYSAELSYLQDRLWYDLTYRNKTFFPGFKAQLSSEPSYLSFTAGDQDEAVTHTLLRQNRSLSLSVPLQVRLDQNIFSTSFYIEPEIRQSQMRVFEIGGSSGKTDFANITASNLYSQFNYRLQQNIRDIQPNSGATFYSEIEHYFQADDLYFRAYNNNITLNLQEATALQAGIYTYWSPLRRWNQSLRISVHGLSQSGLIFDTQSLVSEGFSEPVFPSSDNLLSINSRYTIPLAFVDDGGFLLPFYLSNIYLVAFSNTVTDPGFHDVYEQSRSVFGLGIRTRFRLSNLTLDLGIGVGYEPTRGDHQFFIGEF